MSVLTTMASMRKLQNSSDPGVSETHAEVGILFLNTTTKNQFVCIVATSGSQVWQQVQPYTVVGSWTPVLTGTGSAGTVTYATQVGSYTSFGNLAIAWFNLAWSLTTGTGNTTVTGMPVSCASAVGVTFIPAWSRFSLGILPALLQGNVAATKISFAKISLGGTARPLALPSAGSLSGSFIFPVGS